MSELDFEDDIASENAIPIANLNKVFGKKSPINSDETIASKTNITDISVGDKNKEYHKDNEQFIDQNSEEGEVESDADELSESGQDVNDLEEGEINDSNTEGNKSAVCRFFQNGNCRFGLQCRFIHIGASAYKMFDQSTKSFPFGVTHQASLYQPPKLNPVVSYPTTNTGDAWEQGLHEAKKMVLIARDKKETDIEFEEKKLYLGVQKEKVERNKRDVFVRKSNLEDRKKKHSKSFEAESQSKYVRRETNARKQSNHLSKFNSYSESWTDPWRRSRSRNRSRSSSSLSSLSSERRSCAGSCSSACSACSSPGEAYSPSKKRAVEPESKLKRVFSRIFSRSRSRKRSSSCSCSDTRSLSQSCSPKRPLSRSITRKRSEHRSYSRSRSSSGNRFSKKYSKKNLSPRSLSKSELLVSSASDKAQTNEQLKRNHSPASPLLKQRPKRTPSNSGWESCSSDMTISSITCTSLSGSRSSADCSSVKSGTNSISSVVVSSVRNNKTSLQSDVDLLKTYHQFDNNNTNKRRKVQRTISTVKQLKVDDNFVPEISKKPINENLKLERKSPDLNKHCNNQTLLRKPIKKITAAELELLKYVPAKDRRFTLAQTRTNVCTKLGPTTLVTKKIININLKPKSEVVPSKSEISSVSKTPSKAASKTLSRREQLLLQLQAVELAIAKRKTMASPKQ